MFSIASPVAGNFGKGATTAPGGRVLGRWRSLDRVVTTRRSTARAAVRAWCTGRAPARGKRPFRLESGEEFFRSPVLSGALSERRRRLLQVQKDTDAREGDAVGEEFAVGVASGVDLAQHAKGGARQAAVELPLILVQSMSPSRPKTH